MASVTMTIPSYSPCYFKALGLRLKSLDFEQTSSVSLRIGDGTTSQQSQISLEAINFSKVKGRASSEAECRQTTNGNFDSATSLCRQVDLVSRFCAVVQRNNGENLLWKSTSGCSDDNGAVVSYQRIDFRTGELPNANTTMETLPILVRSSEDPVLLARRLYNSWLLYGLEPVSNVVLNMMMNQICMVCMMICDERDNVFVYRMSNTMSACC